MASVTLDHLWINDGTDPSVARSFYVSEYATLSSSVSSEVRTYAGGRRRIIGTGGSAQTLPLSLSLVRAADVAWVQDRQGALVVVRDELGRRLWGTYAKVDAKPRKDRSAGFDVSLTVESVTHDESV